MAGTPPDSPGHALDTGRIPVSKENRRVWGGRQAWSLIRRPAGLVRLDPRPVLRTSRQTNPVLLDSTPLAATRDERSPGARHRSQSTDSSQGRREQLARNHQPRQLPATFKLRVLDRLGQSRAGRWIVPLPAGNLAAVAYKAERTPPLL